MKMNMFFDLSRLTFYICKFKDQRRNKSKHPDISNHFRGINEIERKMMKYTPALVGRE